MSNTCEMHEEFKGQLRDHEKRIVALEKSDAEFTLKIQYLCEKIDTLISWLKAVFFALLASGLGFFVWYLQGLSH
jgi:hypothetical protein